MMTDIVLHAPKKHECRDKQQHAAIRAEYASHFTESGHIVVQMLGDIQRGDQVKRVFVKRQILSDRRLYMVQTTLVTKRDRFR
jgi:hypothetical protein